MKGDGREILGSRCEQSGVFSKTDDTTRVVMKRSCGANEVHAHARS